MQLATLAATSTVTLTDRPSGGELDAWFQVTAVAVDGPWLALTHADGVTTLVQVDPAQAVTVTPDQAA